MAAPRILIIGGGFAGVKCAQTLLRRMRGKAEVVVFSRDNHLVFQPLLPDVAGSSLNPRAIAPPLRQLLPGATCRTEEVLEIDRARSEMDDGLRETRRLAIRAVDHVAAEEQRAAQRIGTELSHAIDRTFGMLVGGTGFEPVTPAV